MNLRFFLKLNCTLNEIQVLVTLRVSIFLLIVLLSHECWRENEGPYIFDVHTKRQGVLEIVIVCGVYCFSTIDLLFIFADGVINCLLFVDVINIWLLTLSFIYSFKICIQFNECLYFYLVYLKSLLHYAKGRYSEMPRSIWRFRI